MPVVTVTASGAFNVVAKTRHARVMLCGGGGAGGSARQSGARGGGAAGGQWAVKRDALTPGTTYSGSVGAAQTTSGTAGNDTTWRTNVCVAKGGAAGGNIDASNGSGTAGTGSTTSGVGDTVRRGGSGQAGVGGALTGGSGGGGAGTTADGGDATTAPAAGTGTALFGGDGGLRGASANAGSNGTQAGGGGGGGSANNTTTRAGGQGAAGRAQVDWIPPCSLLLLGVG